MDDGETVCVENESGGARDVTMVGEAVAARSVRSVAEEDGAGGGFEEGNRADASMMKEMEIEILRV